MEIARAESGDVDDIVECWIALADDQRAHDSHVLGGESEDAVRRSIGRRVVDGDAFVARVDGSIVGFVTFGREDDTYRRDVSRGFVENLFVSPSQRNRGIGSLLLERAEENLAEEGVDVVALEVTAANEAARRFYDRAGYDLHRVELEKAVGSDTH